MNSIVAVGAGVASSCIRAWLASLLDAARVGGGALASVARLHAAVEGAWHSKSAAASSTGVRSISQTRLIPDLSPRPGCGAASRSTCHPPRSRFAQLRHFAGSGARADGGRQDTSAAAPASIAAPPGAMEQSMRTPLAPNKSLEALDQLPSGGSSIFGADSVRLVDRAAPFMQSYGRFNVKRHVPFATRARLYSSDWFHSLVNTRTHRIVLVLITVYVLCYITFAGLFYVADDTCLPDIYPDEGSADGKLRFIRALYFSVETMMTIGYGSKDPAFGGCVAIWVLVTSEALCGVCLQCVFFGIVYTRLSRADSRASTIVFSDRAVVRVADDEVYLVLRIAEMRKHQLMNVRVRTYAFCNTTAGALDGTPAPVSVECMPMRLVLPAGDAQLGTPCLVVHRLDRHSPLLPPKELAALQRLAATCQPSSGAAAGHTARFPDAASSPDAPASSSVPQLIRSLMAPPASWSFKRRSPAAAPTSNGGWAGGQAQASQAGPSAAGAPALRSASELPGPADSSSSASPPVGRANSSSGSSVGGAGPVARSPSPLPLRSAPCDDDEAQRVLMRRMRAARGFVLETKLEVLVLVEGVDATTSSMVQVGAPLHHIRHTRPTRHGSSPDPRWPMTPPAYGCARRATRTRVTTSCGMPPSCRASRACPTAASPSISRRCTRCSSSTLSTTADHCATARRTPTRPRAAATRRSLRRAPSRRSRCRGRSQRSSRRARGRATRITRRSRVRAESKMWTTASTSGSRGRVTRATHGKSKEHSRRTKRPHEAAYQVCDTRAPASRPTQSMSLLARARKPQPYGTQNRRGRRDPLTRARFRHAQRIFSRLSTPYAFRLSAQRLAITSTNLHTHSTHLSSSKRYRRRATPRPATHAAAPRPQPARVLQAVGLGVFAPDAPAADTYGYNKL